MNHDHEVHAQFGDSYARYADLVPAFFPQRKAICRPGAGS